MVKRKTEMQPYEESGYFAVYFYSAIIEFVYFAIIHIESKGPKHITEIEKHLKFFKAEVNRFIHTFNGKDKNEKFCNMLCTATPVFYSTNNVLYLNKNIADFKNIIFEDLIINKIIDIILRGVCDIEKICENLNACSVIKVNKTAFLSFLKQYPCFHINQNDAIILLQCENLMNFHNHTYEIVVQYFLNILQNSYVIRYENIKSHCKFVSSHRFHSYLGTLCILNSCDIFKCENNSVFLLKSYTRKITPKQQFNINYSETDLPDPSSSLTLFIYQTLGPNIFNWTGHVSQVMKNGGLIFCTVGFNDNEQDMFVVYFHKRALKYIGDICNLSEHVVFQDVVEFDAEFCIGAGGRYYQATRVSIKKHRVKNGFFKPEIDLKEYSENISQQYFVQISNLNLQPACPFSFSTLKTSSLITPCIKNQVPTSYNEFVLFLKNSLNLPVSENVGIFCNAQESTAVVHKELHSFKPTFDSEVSNKSKSDFNIASVQGISQETQNYLNARIKDNKVVSSVHHKCELYSDKKLSNNLSCIKTHEDSKKCIFEDDLISTDSSTTPIISKDEINIKEVNQSIPITENENRKKYLDASKDTLNKNIFLQKEKLILDRKQMQNFLILKYTFLFGEVDMLTKEGGIINCYCDTNFTAYFHYKSILAVGDHSLPKNISKFDKVLIFSPNINEDTYPVATLVYVLKDGENILIQKHNLTPQDFTVKYFLPKMKSIRENLTQEYELCPNLTFDFLLETNMHKIRDIRINYKNLVKCLNEIYTLDQNFFRKFLSLLILSLKKYAKLDFRNYTSSYHPIVCKSCKFKRKHKNSSKLAESQNRAQHIPLKNDVTAKQTESDKEKMNLKIKSSILSKSKSENDLKVVKFAQNDQIYTSCSSLSSFISCESKVLSEKFYSCESFANLSDMEEIEFKSPFKYSTSNRNSLSLSDSEISKIPAKCFSFETRDPISNKLIDSSQNSKSDFTKISKHKFFKNIYKNKTLHFNSYSKFKITKVRKEIHTFKFLNSLILTPKPVVKTASICMITNSYIFLTPIHEREFLCFPLKSVPPELKLVLRINLVVEIAYIPFKPLNMSHLLFLRAQFDFE